MDRQARLIEIVDRSLNGPILTEAEFDRKHVAAGVQRVVQEHEISTHPEVIINMDDALADRVWDAALDFLVGCGVYSQSTQRVIRLSREEILAQLEQAPGEIEYGSEEESCRETAREIESARVPLNMGGPIGSPIEEELFLPAMRSYIQEPLVDLTCGASLETAYGQEIRTGSALEIMAAWREVELMRSALDLCGRPGMAWTGVMMSMSDVGQLSTYNSKGLRSTDLYTFGIISELKANDQIFNKIAHAVRMDAIIDPYANPIFGGLGGGEAGQAVLITAAMIALSVFFLADMVGSSPTHPFHFNDTGPELLRATSLAFQALARNSHLMTNLTITPVGGPGTKTLLYECIAYALMSTVSGASRILGPRSATGSISGHFSGLEARFSGEILHAATGLERGRAEEILQRALSKYLDQLPEKPYGRHFGEVYDIETVTPTEEWERSYDQVKAESARWGLSYT